MKKIVQIGFNRCGTRTLCRFFARNGINSLHWEKGQLAERLVARYQRKEDPFSDYPEGVFFSDMESVRRDRPLIEGYRLFRYIFSWYPDAYYILNTRNPEAWLQSRVRHEDGAYLRDFMFLTQIESEDRMLAQWLRSWYEHHADVLRFFEEQGGKLLWFDIDRHGPDRLAAFLQEDFKLDTGLYTHENGQPKAAAASTPDITENQRWPIPAFFQKRIGR